ncbi:F-box/kelch-repeat protein At5g15710 isoform X3 [Physcomitrium patens]|uniref:F-box/kelch-repeat protein At5g15710 isoform X3 n=1 Tax=Physcomitrium patens TaxID=3218 RepID=UPI003CCD4CD9
MSELCEIMSDEPCPMWNKLSSELQDRVLAFLPVLALVNLRTVCKRWATLPSSQSFKILCMLVSPQPSYLLVCRRAHTFCAAYDQSLNLWYDLNLRFLDQMCLPYLECPNGEVYHSVEAASGGLFFIWSHKSDGEPSLYSVCNPVTRTWRKLPSLPYHIVPLAVAMVTDRLTWKYKIFVAADSSPETLLSPMAMQAQSSPLTHLIISYPTIKLLCITQLIPYGAPISSAHIPSNVCIAMLLKFVLITRAELSGLRFIHTVLAEAQAHASTPRHCLVLGHLQRNHEWHSLQKRRGEDVAIRC